MDNSMSRLNEHSLTPPFQYSSIDDLAALVAPGCWIATCDVEAFYHRFSIALLWRFLFGFLWGHLLYYFCVVVFGFGPAPYYASGWSAEFYRWVLHKQIPATVFMDDWATVGADQAEALAHRRAIKDLLSPCGISFSDAKDADGQRVEYLGVLFDTVAMTMSFVEEKASVLRATLVAHYATISSGSNLPHAETRSTAGKLGWYAQCLQAGRLHTRSWWLYVVFGYKLLAPTRARLLKDTLWWIAVLAAWEDSENVPHQFPLLSAHSFWTDPARASVIVSDASGPDGFGYYHGPLGSESPQFGAFPWDDSYKFVNSHCGELTALWHYVERSTASSCLLLWVSDNQAAVYGVNKGTCRPEEGLAILSRILTRCDTLGIVLLAFWVPRELNRVSDYLSHLSVLVRSDVTGAFTSDSAEALASAAAGVVDGSVVAALARDTGVDSSCVEQVMQSTGSSCSSQKLSRQRTYRGSVPPSVRPRQSSPVSPIRDLHFDVLRPACDAQRGQLPESGSVLDRPASGVRPPGSPLAVSGRAAASGSPSESPSERGFSPPASETSSTGASFTTFHCPRGPPGSTPATNVTSALHRSRRPSPRRGSDLGSSDNGRALGPDRTALSLRFTRSKTCLTGPGFLVQFSDRPTPNAVSLMREWWDLMGLHHSRTVCLFPKRLSATRFDWGQSISYDSLVSRVKGATQSIGLPDEDYSGHSLRTGGATDLFVARVPYYIIQRMGRWASDAALVYYRHEEDVLRAVSTAFRYVANPTSGGTLIYREGGVVV